MNYDVYFRISELFPSLIFTSFDDEGCSELCGRVTVSDCSDVVDAVHRAMMELSEAITIVDCKRIPLEG